VVVSLGAIAAATAALRGTGAVSPTTVALTYLLVVLFVASSTSLVVAVGTSVAAMLALNYFFMAPVGTFFIADPHNWVALAAFLIVAVVASQLSSTARARAREAIDQRNEIARLLEGRHAAELARQRADLSSALLAALGHDLRTPLTAIRVAAANAGDTNLDEELRAAQAALALSEIDHLARLLQEILDMARIEAHAVHADPHWVTAGAIVEAAVAHAGSALARHRLVVDADETLELQLDPRLTSAALAHVLENAAQYSPPGTAIHVRASVTQEGLVVTVTDEGPGLDDGELEQLFDAFVRGRAGRKVATGTGLGLAITRGLLAAEGGRVRAERRQPGTGARFTLEVPAPRRPVAPEEAWA
jgi:K+-sensing histidine kinase KdpD